MSSKRKPISPQTSIEDVTPKSKVFKKDQLVIRELSEKIVEAQRPIRILDAIKWDDNIRKDFFKHKCKKLPHVDQQYYHKQALGYDPEEKMSEFFALEHEVRKTLGQFSGVSQIMQRMCREYRESVEMLLHRGTPRFSEISQQLYGSSEDAFYAQAPTLGDLASVVNEVLENLGNKTDNENDKKIYDAEDSAAYLNKKLKRYFGDKSDEPIAVISDDIVADAAAGAEKIKIRRDVMLSKRNLKQLEVHEGWVHLGTTLNGKSQPICTFLSKGPPSSTITQEGLAVLMEIFTFTSYPRRVQRVNDRINAISMAEAGADFIEVFEFFRSKHQGQEDAYNSAVRVFRGSTPKGKPFTKDLSYSKGFVEILNYIRLAIRSGLVEHIPMLFVGKTSLTDLRIIVDLVEEGIVTPPKFLPPQFKDLAALCAWSAYSLFVSKLNPDHLAIDFKDLLRE